MTENPSQRLARIAALESRLGLRLADRLSEGAEKLPHDVTERLRFARGMALSRAPRPYPTLEIVRQPASMFDYTLDDFAVHGYEPHPPIKAPVAV